MTNDEHDDWDLEQEIYKQIDDDTRYYLSKTKTKPIEPGETLSIAIGREKVAALLYDRIYFPFLPNTGQTFDWPEFDKVPSEISWFGHSNLDEELVRHTIARGNLWLFSTSLMGVGTLDSPSGTGKMTPEETGYQQDPRPHPFEIASEKSGYSAFDVNDSEENYIAKFARAISADAMKSVPASRTVPVYRTGEALETNLKTGGSEVLVATIDALGVIDEGKLSWEQVLEFRRDGKARKQLQEFTHWLNGDMADKDLEFVVDEISLKLERYNALTRKHGLETVLGSLKVAVDARTLFPALLATATTAVADFSTWISVAAAGGVAIANGVLDIANMKVDQKHERTGGFREVAFVNTLRDKVTTKS